MSLQIVTPPAVEPVTLDEAKAQLKLDTDADDDLVARLIPAARARAEWHLGRALITQSWTLWLDAWPCAPANDDWGALGGAGAGIIEIPLPPLQSVTSLTAYALDDGATVLDASLYQVDASSAPARLALRINAAPPTNLRRINALALVFTAGYGDAASDVPAGIRAAILELIAFLYEHRGEAPAELPSDVLALLAPYRILHL
jgi:uncharacterized phiE125 gp8 family phage protein